MLPSDNNDLDMSEHLHFHSFLPYSKLLLGKITDPDYTDSLVFQVYADTFIS
jgi:hypothetical protein